MLQIAEQVPVAVKLHPVLRNAEEEPDAVTLIPVLQIAESLPVAVKLHPVLQNAD